MPNCAQYIVTGDQMDQIQAAKVYIKYADGSVTYHEQTTVNVLSNSYDPTNGSYSYIFTVSNPNISTYFASKDLYYMQLNLVYNRPASAQ